MPQLARLPHPERVRIITLNHPPAGHLVQKWPTQWVRPIWWGRQGSNLRPRDYESPALTTELLPPELGFVLLSIDLCPALCPTRSKCDAPTTANRPQALVERPPGHFELRAYNAATGKQVVRTACTPATATDGASGSPLAELLDEWMDHGETRGRSRNTIHGYRSKAKRIKAGPLGAMPAPPVE